MRVFYAEANYGAEEIKAATKVLHENRLSLMCGENVELLEKRIARLFRKNFALMTNSGSSANLMGVKALNLPKGSKVITPSLTFSTTVDPIFQLGYIPRFIGVEKNKFVAHNFSGKYLDCGSMHGSVSYTHLTLPTKA